MRIIALQGKHNCGKTATLKKLIEIVHKGNFTYEGVKPNGDVLELCQREKGDMQYWCSCNGVKIGITTRGDARRYLQADFFENRRNFSDRDIVVCAIRSSGGTVDFLYEHSIDEPIICKKALIADIADKKQMAEVNAKQAKKIFEKLKLFTREMEEQK